MTKPYRVRAFRRFRWYRSTRRLGRRATRPPRRGTFSVARLYHVARDTARAASAANEHGLGTPDPTRHDVTHVEHLALPAVSLAQDVEDRWHEHRGEWVLDPGHTRWAQRYSYHATTDEAMTAALELRPDWHDDKVWIRFRSTDGPGVQPFVEPHTATERLAEHERERRGVLSREQSHRRTWEKEQARRGN